MITHILDLELFPDHDLTQTAKLVDCVDAVTAVYYLITLCDVLVLNTFYDVQFVVKHVQTVCEVSIWGEESLFLESHLTANFKCEVCGIFLDFVDFAECALSELLANLVVVNHLIIVGIVPSLSLVDLH